MQNKRLKLFLFFLYTLILQFSVNAQYKYTCRTKRNFNPTNLDSCEVIHIENKIQTTLTKVCQLKYIGAISIYNKNRTAVVIPIELTKINRMYDIEMNECKNDSMFMHFKALYGISYESDYFNPKLLLYDSLFNLRVGVKKGKIRNITSEPNTFLRLLQIRTKDEQFLDSSFLNLKVLTKLELNFNPFLLSNYFILNKMDSLKEIKVINRNFRNFHIDIETLALFLKYRITFTNCRFTRTQKQLLRRFKNLDRSSFRYYFHP